MNMKLLELITPLSIYHGCSTWKMLCEENFTPMNIENCVRHNVMKHREIKDGEKYTTLDISLDFGSLDKIIITYSEPKDYLGILGKGLITSMGLKTIIRSNKNVTVKLRDRKSVVDFLR